MAVENVTLYALASCGVITLVFTAFRVSRDFNNGIYAFFAVTSIILYAMSGIVQYDVSMTLLFIYIVTAFIAGMIAGLAISVQQNRSLDRFLQEH